ncbi:MAG: hypothetical protein N4A35_16825 [Flavobacteriales bacterium]|nr:hypothetical protein [Flavobacteriales bacterium]
MRLILVFLIVFPFVSKAQLLDNRECLVFSDAPFFYTKFIQQNQIKQITGVISTKKNLQVIEQRNLVNTYVFDQKGRLSKQYRSFNGSNSKDTTFITYHYNENDVVEVQRTSDSYGFFSNNYTFNEAGDVLSKTYCRDENLSRRNNFKLGKQHIIVQETFSYEKSDSTLSKSTYNSHGKKYQTITSFYNEHGLKYKEEKKLLINKKKSITNYQYDDKGNVSEKTVYPDFNKSYHTTTKYQYDVLGNLEYIDEYKNDTHVTHKEIIYNKSTLLMKALLIQDIETNYIKIIKYSYQYW